MYISNLAAANLYVHANRRSWLLVPVLLLWISRLWLLASRGELHEDPVVYAITDQATSWLLGAVSAVVVLVRAVTGSVSYPERTHHDRNHYTIYARSTTLRSTRPFAPWRMRCALPPSSFGLRKPRKTFGLTGLAARQGRLKLLSEAWLKTAPPEARSRSACASTS